MQKTYLFYDLETSGLNKAFDQVLQFAAIRTDMQLKEIERNSIMIKLRPDVVYSPGAMLTTHISIEQAENEGLPEVEGIRRIHELMNRAGTISTGYNTLGFDDEFLRFSFHRNLLPPYTHQYDRGCGRMDMFPMAVIYHLYKNDVMDWPLIDGKTTLKLEHLSAANGFARGRAHDAMVDVEATVELARRFYGKRDMWDYLTGCFDKQTDNLRINKIPEAFQSRIGLHRRAVMADGGFGTDSNFQAPVLSLGNSIPYKNQTLWLRLDLPELLTATPDNIFETTWVVRKRNGEPGIILPPAQRFWDRITPEKREIAAENEKRLRSDADLFSEIARYHMAFKYDYIPDLDPDAALYQNGFLSYADQKKCTGFHAASTDEKAEMAGSFERDDISELAKRLIWRNYPDDLPESLMGDFENYMKRVNPPGHDQAIVDYKGQKRTTPSKALDEIAEFRKQYEAGSTEADLLNSLEDSLKKRFGI